MIVPRDATDLILTVYLGSGVTGKAFNAVDLAVALLVPGDTGFANVSLVAGTLGQYVANSWAEIGAGYYQFCPPNSAIAPGKSTSVKVTVGGGEPVNGTIVAVGAIASQTIAEEVLTGLLPSAVTFLGQIGSSTTDDVRIKQKDDYNAIDGRAWQWAVVNPSIDFTQATVAAGAAAGTDGENTLAGTLSLWNKTNGTCTLRLEFTSAQTNVPPGRYDFDAHILVDSRRVTAIEINATVIGKYAD